VTVTCKTLPGDQKLLAASDPERFYMPSYIGPKGWVALRLDGIEIDWEEVSELAAGSYRMVAPKRAGRTGCPTMRRLVRAVRKALRDAADPVKAPIVQSYMKSAMRIWGSMFHK